MRDALKLPLAAAAVLSASQTGFESYYTTTHFTGRAVRHAQPKKRNPNAAKQAAARRARKITRRHRHGA